MEEILQKLDLCFDLLQNLSVKTTLGNMENLVKTLYLLREVYDQLGKENQNAGENGRAADPGEPDD